MLSLGYSRIPLFHAALATLVVVVLMSSAGAERDDPDGEGPLLWSEPDGLTMQERLPWRPGNFLVLSAVGEFLDGQWALRPEPRSVVYPFFAESERVVHSADEAAATMRRLEGRHKEAGAPLTNHARRYVFNISEVRLFNVGEEGVDSLTLPEDVGLPERTASTIVEARKAHPGLMVLLRVSGQMESLRSDKIEDMDDSYLWVLTVRTKAGWRVCMLYKDY